MRKIYVYETPASKREGLVKIGDANDVEARVNEQLNTAAASSAEALAYTILFECDAIRLGEPFRDHDIHRVLGEKGYQKHQLRDGDTIVKTTEWFKIDAAKAIHLIKQYAAGVASESINIDRHQSFGMRPEQVAAVEQTQSFFGQHATMEAVSMLWNAKMRFGKTFTAYQLAKRMALSKVLVITYKPAVEDAWQKDLDNHVDFSDYIFLRRNSLASIKEHSGNNQSIVAFASFQDLLGGADEDNAIKARHAALFDTQWDIVIIDEFHYGAGTKRAKELLVEQAATAGEIKAIDESFYSQEDEEKEAEAISETVALVVDKSIKAKYRLYLSGTPFKAIADSRFPAEAIYNWTYTDEQRAKAAWDDKHPMDRTGNPYRGLPAINMYLYKVSDDLIAAGTAEGKDEFSLNHFFKTDKKKFIHEAAVKRWLDLISGSLTIYESADDELVEKTDLAPANYPFDQHGPLLANLSHTLWYLNRVDSAYALRDLLKEHAIFRHYSIILAAGKGLKSGVDAVQPVLDQIDANERTITLSVGKLTTGVSIPKWTGVMFLRDTDSPENYFQTAFRAQTPFTDPRTGAIKEVCYIFDFSPNRSLKLLTSYSEKLSTDSALATSEHRIAEFIRYLPVLKIMGNSMESMDARDVLTFDLSGIDAKGLGERFIQRQNIIVTRDVIDALNASAEVSAQCQAIFNKIKMFKKFTGASDADSKASDVDLAKLDLNNKKIKKLSTKETDSGAKEGGSKELETAEKESKSEREKIRELLRSLLTRIPIFMYLTDATEENLEQVLVETKHDLFRKATGVTLDDFRFLRDIGLIKIDSIDGYILSFLKLENDNYVVTNAL